MNPFNQMNVSKLFDVAFSKRVLWTLVAMTALVFVASLINRYIYIDDAFFGEQAFWLARDGVVKTKTLIDFLGADQRLFSYHKLHIFSGAILIELFGWSVTPLRLASLTIYIGFLWIFIQYFRRNISIQPNQPQLSMALFFLTVNPLIVLHAFTFRPEIWVMFFGFVSYLFLNKQEKGGIPIMQTTAAGVAAGLAFLTHLNGLIFLVAGGMLLLVRKQLYGLLFFSMAGILTASLYALDLWQPGHLEAWLFQLRNWPDNNATNYLSSNVWELIQNMFVKLSQEHQRFFWSPKVWGISSFFLLVVFSQFRWFIRTHPSLMLYLLTLILTLNLAGSQIAERFLIYFFPWMAIIIALGLTRLMHTSGKPIKIIFIFLLALQLVTVGLQFSNIFKRNAPQARITESIFTHIPHKNQLTLVPYNLIYNALNQYPLASFKGFEYEEVAMGHPFDQASFFRRAVDLNIHSIVIPLPGFRNTTTGLACFKNGIISDTLLYRQHYRDERCVILVKK